MRFLKSLLFIFIALLVGCSNTPEDAVRNVYVAIQEGDTVKLVNNSTDKVSGALIVTALGDCHVNKKEYTDDMKLVEDCLVEKYNNINIKKIKIIMVSESQADANVTLQRAGEEYDYQLKVVKIENRWKVSMGEE